MTQPVPPTFAAVARNWRVLAGALAGAPIVIGIALTFVLTSDSTTGRNGQPITPKPTGVSTTAIAIEVALAVVVALLVEMVGYRTAPLAPGTPETTAVAQSTQRFQTAMFLRFALCEAVAVVSVAIAFVVSTRSPLNYWVGGVLGALLVLLHVYPNGRVVDRMTAALEANGVQSPLPEMFGRIR